MAKGKKPFPIDTARSIIRMSLAGVVIPESTRRAISSEILNEFGKHNLAITYKYPSPHMEKKNEASTIIRHGAK